MNIQLGIEFGNISEKVTRQQGAIDLLGQRPGGRDLGAGGSRGILESKAAGNLPVLGTDKNAFRL